MKLNLLARFFTDIEGHCIYFEKISGNRISNNSAYRVVRNEKWHYVCRPLDDITDNNLVKINKFFLPKGTTNGWILMNPGWAYAYTMNANRLIEKKYDYANQLNYVHSWLESGHYILDPESRLYDEPVLKRGWWKGKEQ